MDEKYRSEYDLILATGERPVVSDDIRSALEEMGLGRGSRLIMHSSLKRIGWTVGGERTIVESVLEQIGDEGLLAMPAHSNELSDPAHWENPPVPAGWQSIIRKHMPSYDPELSGARRLGTVADYFRRLPGVKRSAHPHFSLAARGRGADELTSDHAFDFAMGSASPYGRLYDLNAKILLYGVDYGNCSLLHLCEYLGDWTGKAIEKNIAPVGRTGGITVWKEYSDYSYDSDDFNDLGLAFEAEYPEFVERRRFFLGELVLVESRPLVDFGVKWLERNRGGAKQD